MKRSSGAPRRKCARGVEILRATELNIRLRPTAMPVTGSGATSSAFAQLQCPLRAPARQVPPSPDCNAGYGLRRDKFRLRPTAMPVTGSGATSSVFARLQRGLGLRRYERAPRHSSSRHGRASSGIRRGTDESKIDPGRLDAAGPRKLAGLEAFLAEDWPPLRRLERHRRLLRSEERRVGKEGRS